MEPVDIAPTHVYALPERTGEFMYHVWSEANNKSVHKHFNVYELFC